MVSSSAPGASSLAAPGARLGVADGAGTSAGAAVRGRSRSLRRGGPLSRVDDSADCLGIAGSPSRPAASAPGASFLAAPGARFGFADDAGASAVAAVRGRSGSPRRGGPCPRVAGSAERPGILSYGSAPRPAAPARIPRQRRLLCLLFCRLFRCSFYLDTV